MGKHQAEPSAFPEHALTRIPPAIRRRAAAFLAPFLSLRMATKLCAKNSRSRMMPRVPAEGGALPPPTCGVSGQRSLTIRAGLMIVGFTMLSGTQASVASAEQRPHRGLRLAWAPSMGSLPRQHRMWVGRAGHNVLRRHEGVGVPHCRPSCVNYRSLPLACRGLRSTEAFTAQGRGRHRWGAKNVGPLHATTTVPPATTAGGSPDEDHRDFQADPLTVVTVLGDDERSGVHSGQAAYTLPSAGPSNDTVVPAGDPRLVSGILDIVGSQIDTPIELPTASSVSEAAESPECSYQDVGLPLSTIGAYEDISEALSVPEEPPARAEPVYGEKNPRAMVTELVGFTLPLLAVWLSNPIMSLVDTAVVGAQSSMELAALGPGTSLCDNVAYMCGFLAQVTTNLGASALARGDDLKADRATRTGLFVAAGVGLVVSHTLLTRGKSLLQFVLGGNASVSGVLPFSCSYVYIRALGFVAVTMSMVLQGAFLARKDVATPIKSVAGASVVNLVLDCVAVFVFGMGIKGAALATSAAQWAGLLFLLKQFWPDLRKSGKVSVIPFRKELTQFLSLGLPTCMALSGQVATCMAVTVAASGCNTVALAAHQVIYGVFLLFCPIGEAVSQTVQTYLPAFTVKRPPLANGKPRRTLTFGKSAVRMIKVMSAVALGLGAVNSALATLLTSGLPSIFTPDPAVWEAMRSVSPLCGLALALHGVTMALQGTMMATRQVGATAGIYSVSSVVFASMFVLMRRSPALSLASVWKTFVLYQVTRCAVFAATVALSHRQSLHPGVFSEPARDGTGAVILGIEDASVQVDAPRMDDVEAANTRSSPRGFSGTALAMRTGERLLWSPKMARLGIHRGLLGSLLRRRKQE